MMLAMDAAWLVLKEELLEWPDKDERITGGAYRGVFPHPTDPEQVIKIPHSGAINHGEIMHTAHNQALAAAGEPVLPETPVLFNRPVTGYGNDEAGSFSPAAGFAQTRLQHPTIKRQIDEVWRNLNNRRLGLAAETRLNNIGMDFAYGPDKATLTSALSRDLHNDNLSFNVPTDQLSSLRDGELRNKILAIDGMSRFASAHDKMDDDVPEDSSDLLGRLLFAHDQDPEKFNAYMAKLGDRAQFDPWMDALVHQPNTDTDRGIPTASSPKKIAERQRAGQSNAINSAYNEYVRALNATRRLAGFIQDPYQTTLNEYAEIPEFMPQPTSPYHDTILREAIIRARKLQAERVAQGLPPTPPGWSGGGGPESMGHTLHDLIRDKIRPQFEEEIVQGNAARIRNDMGREMPFVRRLLGPERERQVLRRE